MGKTVLILAPIIVGLAVLWLAFWLGKLAQRIKTEIAAAHISPKVHHDLRELVRDLLHPSDLADPPYLPAAVRQRAERVLKDADENKASADRAMRRRAGY